MSKVIPVMAAVVALALASWSITAPALADGSISRLMSQEETRLLEEFDARRARAVAAAATQPDEVAVATLMHVLSGQTLPFDQGYDPSGDWRCRFLTLAEDSALLVRGWFSCRIYDDGAGWVLQKEKGSQRRMGRLYRLTAERLLYLGALQEADETPIWFGDDPPRNEMAVLSRLDDGRLRLEYPAPLAGSAFDILELAH